MKPLGWVVAVAAALLFGGFWLRSHDKQVRATAELVKRDATLNALRDSLENADGVRLVERRRADLLIMSLRETIMSDSILADSLRTAGSVRYVELRGALPSHLRLTLDSLMQTFARERQAKDSIAAAYQREAQLLRMELAKADSLIVGYQKALSLAVEQRDGWKKQAGRKWFGCTVGPGVNTKGPSVAGVSCGLRVL